MLHRFVFRLCPKVFSPLTSWTRSRSFLACTIQALVVQKYLRHVHRIYDTAEITTRGNFFGLKNCEIDLTMPNSMWNCKRLQLHKSIEIFLTPVKQRKFDTFFPIFCDEIFEISNASWNRLLRIVRASRLIRWKAENRGFLIIQSRGPYDK